MASAANLRDNNTPLDLRDPTKNGSKPTGSSRCAGLLTHINIRINAEHNKTENLAMLYAAFGNRGKGS